MNFTITQGLTNNLKSFSLFASSHYFAVSSKDAVYVAAQRLMASGLYHGCTYLGLNKLAALAISNIIPNLAIAYFRYDHEFTEHAKKSIWGSSTETKRKYKDMHNGPFSWSLITTMTNYYYPILIETVFTCALALFERKVYQTPRNLAVSFLSPPALQALKGITV